MRTSSKSAECGAMLNAMDECLRFCICKKGAACASAAVNTFVVSVVIDETCHSDSMDKPRLERIASLCMTALDAAQRFQDSSNEDAMKRACERGDLTLVQTIVRRLFEHTAEVSAASAPAGEEGDEDAASSPILSDARTTWASSIALLLPLLSKFKATGNVSKNSTTTTASPESQSRNEQTRKALIDGLAHPLLKIFLEPSRLLIVKDGDDGNMRRLRDSYLLMDKLLVTFGCASMLRDDGNNVESEGNRATHSLSRRQVLARSLPVLSSACRERDSSRRKNASTQRGTTRRMAPSDASLLVDAILQVMGTVVVTSPNAMCWLSALPLEASDGSPIAASLDVVAYALLRNEKKVQARDDTSAFAWTRTESNDGVLDDNTAGAFDSVAARCVDAVCSGNGDVPSRFALCEALIESTTKEAALLCSATIRKLAETLTMGVLSTSTGVRADQTRTLGKLVWDCCLRLELVHSAVQLSVAAFRANVRDSLATTDSVVSNSLWRSYAVRVPHMDWATRASLALQLLGVCRSFVDEGKLAQTDEIAVAKEVYAVVYSLSTTLQERRVVFGSLLKTFPDWYTHMSSTHDPEPHSAGNIEDARASHNILRAVVPMLAPDLCDGLEMDDGLLDSLNHEDLVHALAEALVSQVADGEREHSQLLGGSALSMSLNLGMEILDAIVSTLRSSDSEVDSALAWSVASCASALVAAFGDDARRRIVDAYVHLSSRPGGVSEKSSVQHDVRVLESILPVVLGDSVLPISSTDECVSVLTSVSEEYAEVAKSAGARGRAQESSGLRSSIDIELFAACVPSTPLLEAISTPKHRTQRRMVVSSAESTSSVPKATENDKDARIAAFTARIAPIVRGVVDAELHRMRRIERANAFDALTTTKAQGSVGESSGAIADNEATPQKSYTICARLLLLSLLYCSRDVDTAIFDLLISELQRVLRVVMLSLEEDIELMADIIAEHEEAESADSTSIARLMTAALRRQRKERDVASASDPELAVDPKDGVAVLEAGLAMCSLPLFHVSRWQDARGDVLFDCARIIISYAAVTSLWRKVHQLDNVGDSGGESPVFTHLTQSWPPAYFSRIAAMSEYGGSVTLDRAVTSYIAWSEDAGLSAIHPGEALYMLLECYGHQGGVEQTATTAEASMASAAMVILTDANASGKLIAYRESVRDFVPVSDIEALDGDDEDNDAKEALASADVPRTATGDLELERRRCEAGVPMSLCRLLRPAWVKARNEGTSHRRRKRERNADYARDYRSFLGAWSLIFMRLRALNAGDEDEDEDAEESGSASADAPSQKSSERAHKLAVYEFLASLRPEETFFPIVASLLPFGRAHTTHSGFDASSSSPAVEHNRMRDESGGAQDEEEEEEDDKLLARVLRQSFFLPSVFKRTSGERWNAEEFTDLDAEDTDDSDDDNKSDVDDDNDDTEEGEEEQYAVDVYDEAYMSLITASFRCGVSALPVYAREWFCGLRRKAMIQAVERYMELVVTPSLLRAEKQAILRANLGGGGAFDDEGLKVRVLPTEVIAEYVIDESSLELVIRLPPVFPLRCVKVECVRRVGISESRLRKWLLSVSSFVTNRNGTLLQAVHYWRRNIEREFDGVEECCICYSVIHTTDASLPKLSCRTCRKKFHSSCLLKWFRSSQKSICPMCQSPW